MFSEYLDLTDYADSIGMADGLLIPGTPSSEDWGFIFNHAINNTNVTQRAFYFPFRAAPYVVQTTLTINRQVLLRGAGSQLPRGVVLQFKNTAPLPNLDVGVHITSKYVVMQGIYFGSTFDLEGQRVKTGIRIDAPKVRIENCTLFYFEQKGIDILENADSWYLKNVQIAGHGVGGFTHSGLHVRGNMGYGVALNILAMESSAILDESTLGNTYVGCHTNQTGSNGNPEEGVYVMQNGLMIGNYAETNQNDIYVGEDAQLWNGHTELTVKHKDTDESNIGTVHQPQYQHFSFAFPKGSSGLRFENHLLHPVFLTFGGREDTTFFEFVGLNDIFTQTPEPDNLEGYLKTYENLLKAPYDRWRLGIDNEDEVYKWYFSNMNTPGIVLSSNENFADDSMEAAHIGFMGFYMLVERSGIFIGAADNKDELPILSGGLGSMIFNTNPTLYQSGTINDNNYLGWLTVINENNQEEQIGVELLQS